MDPTIRNRFNDDILSEAMRRYDIAPDDIEQGGGFESFIYRYTRDDERFILRLTHTFRRTPELIRGEVDWINYLAAGGATVARAVVSAGGELVEAVARALAIIREERAALGIDTSSSVNLFLADGTQVAAVRYCFDFGRYATADPARVHEANLNFLSLWYTLGHGYGLHDGEWRMTGGAEWAGSILVASEPLTRDVASWVEVPEYSLLHATIRGGRPAVTLRYLD